ncbi:unnamed protein product, partial [Protopolystoma xenopodis]
MQLILHSGLLVRNLLPLDLTTRVWIMTPDLADSSLSQAPDSPCVIPSDPSCVKMESLSLLDSNSSFLSHSNSYTSTSPARINFVSSHLSKRLFICPPTRLQIAPSCTPIGLRLAHPEATFENSVLSPPWPQPSHSAPPTELSIHPANTQIPQQMDHLTDEILSVMFRVVAPLKSSELV